MITCAYCGSQITNPGSPPPSPEAAANNAVVGLCFCGGTYLGFKTGGFSPESIILTLLFWFGIQCGVILLWRFLGGNKEKAAYQAILDEWSRSSNCPQCARISLELKKAAYLEDAEAQFKFGLKFANCEDGVWDYKQAVRWFRKAAEQGHAQAQYKLGAIYRAGQDVTKDDAEAVEWFRKAADQGHAQAQNILGVMVAKGLGVPKEGAKAIEWFQKAADQGHMGAQYNLGMMYKNGHGVAKDKTKSIEWFQKAANQGHAGAQNEIRPWV